MYVRVACVQRRQKEVRPTLWGSTSWPHTHVHTRARWQTKGHAAGGLEEL